MKNSTALPVPFGPFVRLLVAAGALASLASLGALVCSTASAEDVTHINGAVSVDDGQHAGNVSTVNGSVDVGANAAVLSARTVNGDIHLAHDSSATSVETVNGAIHLGQHSHVAGNVRAVNGLLEMEGGSSVDGWLAAVNGAIRMNGAHAGRIKTSNADIDLGPNTVIDGDLVVERAGAQRSHDHLPKIVIGPGAVIKGKMRFQGPVNLYVSDKATTGAIEGATPQRFSGDAPP